MDAAVQAAVKAQIGWAATNPQRRARVMFEFKRLVEANIQPLAELLSSQHGKVVADSKGDVQRGLEVIEFACGVPHALKGEYTEGAGPGIDVYSMRQPLGVVAGITPFNFPAMIPMWMFGVAIAVGNAFILKPSEKDPSLPVRLGELFMEAGANLGMDLKGVLNVVNGDKTAVDAILDHPDIKAISFVGSSDIAQYIYSRGTANGKRVQAMGGAKNHGVILPDADMDMVVKDLSGAAFGSAGRAVHGAAGGRARRQEDRRRAARTYDRRDGDAEGRGFRPTPPRSTARWSPPPIATRSPTTSKWARTKARNWWSTGAGSSCRATRRASSSARPLFDHVKPGMKTYQEEIFGPVLQIVRAESFEEAVALPSQHQYGNGVAIFTPLGPGGAGFRQPGERRHGGDQRADPRAGGLPHLRRLEALGFRRHQPARHGRREVLDQG